MIVSMIVAIAENGCIGKDNELPWPRISEDMKWFKTHTTDKVVLMGSNTWFSLPKRPLPNRHNVVISSKPAYDFISEKGSPELIISGEPHEVIGYVSKKYPEQQELMIIGGANIYRQYRQFCDRLYVTRIHKEFEGDCFLNIDLAENQFEAFFTHESKGDDFDITYEILQKVRK